MIRFFRNKITLFLLTLVLVGGLLRFYNLNWGAPYYFHPDERNIATSISQLSLPENLNPKFFAYGSLPIYLIYFTGIYMHMFFGNFHFQVPFEEAILISRFYSAVFATALIPLMYFVGKKLGGVPSGVIAAVLTTFVTGFIQFAHFGTFEMWLTLGSLVLFYLCLKYLEKGSTQALVLMALTAGILCAVKVSSLALLILPIGAIIWPTVKHIKKSQLLLTLIKNLLLFSFMATIVYILSNPYVFLDFQSFENSMRYESQVALGTLPVFYTGEFIHIVPILYPIFRIYPFLLNPLLTALAIPAIMYISFQIYKRRSSSYLLPVTCYLLLFLSQALLYVQWTRYYAPTLPFLLLIVSVAISLLIKNTKRQIRNAVIGGTVFIVIVTAIFGASYFITAFIEKDTRVAAVEFARKEIPKNSKILSEVYDLGIVPFNTYYPNIRLFDFYALEDGKEKIDPSTIVEDADFVILPSQRIMKVRLQNPITYPNGHMFYQELTNGTLGYTLIYQTPCSLWCEITYLTDPIYSFEQTANVFDRPTVVMYKKNQK